MARELKVYGWLGFRHDANPAANGSRQTREIIAAHSVAEVLQVAGITRSEYNYSGSETWNDKEVAVAMSEPGTVFWTEARAAYHSDAHWRAARG